MLNRTAARRRPLSRLHYLLSLLALVGATTALLAVTRVEAHPSDRPVGALAETGHRTRPQGAGPGRPDTARPVDVHRSLIWSGVLGLAISLTGLGIVGVRRRMW